MQLDRHWQDQTLVRFMQLSRLHLGLTQAPVGARPPHRVAAGPSRQILRSLVVAGSLGALFGSPAFAAEASRQADPAKRNPNAQTTRHKADDPPIPAHRLPVVGKPR